MKVDDLRQELRKLMMADEDMTPAAVAVSIKVSERTVRRFLAGEGNHRLVLKAIREFVASKISEPDHKVAVG